MDPFAVNTQTSSSLYNQRNLYKSLAGIIFYNCDSLALGLVILSNLKLRDIVFQAITRLLRKKIKYIGVKIDKDVVTLFSSYTFHVIHK